jgi:murein L,D-transpeptidase YafK
VKDALGHFLIKVLCLFTCIGAYATPGNTYYKSSIALPEKPIVRDNGIYTGPLPDGVLVDSIAVHKSQRELLAFHNHHLIKIYKMHLGTCPAGCKTCRGDGKTPEGLYYIKSRNPASLFHKSLGISYPSAADIARAQKTGKSTGGDVMIHGLPNGEENAGPNRYQNDWTLGCIALSNADIDELFAHVKVGIPIFIAP